MSLRKQLLSLSLFILLIPSISVALSSDQTKKLYIRSKTANINRTTGIGVFIGDVVIDQGTTHVTGDKVITYNDKNNKLKQVTIIGLNGHFAHYKTLTELKKPPLYATARTIKYYPKSHYVILIKDGHIKQGTDSIDGQHLEYDIQKQVLNSTAITKTNGKNSRTTIIIQPDGSSSTKTGNS